MQGEDRRQCYRWLPKAQAYCCQESGHQSRHRPGKPCEVCGRLIRKTATTGRCSACMFPPDAKCGGCGKRLRSDNTTGFCSPCNTKATARRRTSELAQVKVASGCADCGFNVHPDALCFSYTGDGKSPQVARMVACSRSRLQAVIVQCDVVCANCQAHRLAEKLRARFRDHENSPSSYMYLERRDKVAQVKLSTGCKDCGFRRWSESLQFDHVNGNKIIGVARMTGSSWEKVSAEIAKCEVVCANCHRIRTAHSRTMV